MYRETILLQDIGSVKKFVSLASSCDFAVKLISDRYAINGKSIMGIFGLNLSKPLVLEVQDDCPPEFKEKVSEFRVDIQTSRVS